MKSFDFENETNFISLKDLINYLICINEFNAREAAKELLRIIRNEDLGIHKLSLTQGLQPYSADGHCQAMDLISLLAQGVVIEWHGDRVDPYFDRRGLDFWEMDSVSINYECFLIPKTITIELIIKEYFFIKQNNKKNVDIKNNTHKEYSHLNSRERNNLHSIIGGLLSLLINDKKTNRNQSGIITELTNRFSGNEPFSKRNLEKIFSAANKELEQRNTSE